MTHYNFMDRLRSYFGLRSEVPRNDFRNPIWGSDDDDDDGDELYTRHQMEDNNEAKDLHREFVHQMQDVFRNFGILFGDIGTLLNDQHFTSIGTMPDAPESDIAQDNFDSNHIREYYLKPGYHKETGRPKEDFDLDGKISSNQFSDMLKLKDGGDTTQSPFRTQVAPGSFSKTIITTSITKSDGTTETHRIIRSGNEVVEETITSTEPIRGIHNPIKTTPIISHLSSFFDSFH